MSWTLTTSGAAIVKSGANHSTALDTEGAGILQDWSDQVEATLSALTRYDWISNYATLTPILREILGDTASDMIATKIINYDMSGYTSRSEAQTMLDVIRDNLVRNLEALKDTTIREKIE